MSDIQEDQEDLTHTQELLPEVVEKYWGIESV
jgi:hypothetical protein